MSGNSTSAAVGALGWGYDDPGAGPNYQIGVASHPGVFRVTTATTTGSTAKLWLQSNSLGTVFGNTDRLDSTAIVRVPINDPDQDVRVGFHNGTASQQIGFECLAADTNWFAVIDDSDTSPYRVNMGVSCSKNGTSWQRIRIVNLGGGRYLFIVKVDAGQPYSQTLDTTNTSLCGASQACLPTTALIPQFSVVNTDATTAKQLDVDYYDLSIGAINR